MQTVSFVQQKGGVGKTTLLVTLTGLMSEDGANVLIIDTDNQKSALKWASKVESHVTYADTTDEDVLESTLDKVKTTKTDITLIDTIGANSSLVSYVISQSDLVIIPLDTTETDMECADEDYQACCTNS